MINRIKSQTARENAKRSHINDLKFLELKQKFDAEQSNLVKEYSIYSSENSSDFFTDSKLG